jgi:hypothetical protein
MACRTYLKAANVVMAAAAGAAALAAYGPAAWSMATAPRLPVIDPESAARRGAILDAQIEVHRERQRRLGLFSGPEGGSRELGTAAPTRPTSGIPWTGGGPAG